MDMLHKEKLTVFKWSKNAPQSPKELCVRLQADHKGRRGKGGTQDGVEVGQENVNRLQTEGLKHNRGHLSREGQVLRDHLADVFSMAALGPGTSVNQNGLGFQVEMIIVVYNKSHSQSNVSDYQNNFIIITISQDNYFRPPPPLIATSFLDDVSDISDLEVEDMPGAQAEEPPADEERSEPVQVGGFIFQNRNLTSISGKTGGDNIEIRFFFVLI